MTVTSCHIERFLQNVNSHCYDLTSTDFVPPTHQSVNFQVANPTMPANYFHILRRQMLRDYRKPLILATPKQGLRHALAVSKREEMAEGTRFRPVLVNNYAEAEEKVDTVIVCSGKVFFDIHGIMKDAGMQNILVLRLEELAPFPVKGVEAALAKVGKNARTVWLQDEPMNQGCYAFAKMYLERILRNMEFKEKDVSYIGRKSVQSVATGNVKDHKR